MLDFTLRKEDSGESTVATDLAGSFLLDTPIFNKGTAFTTAERTELGLNGLLPPYATDIHEQLERTYHEFSFKPTDMEKHIYLRALQDRNEVLFYRLLLSHLEEMMPLVYTPVVGWACRHFSHIYRRPRGLFISYPQKDEIELILENRAFKHVDVIVVTDGERILGLGDQGVGGMGIPVGKLSLYSLCAGIHPARTLPIVLDTGTDNEERLADPHYLGWRHGRVRGQAYLDFIDRFVEAVKKKLPDVLLQWEDFSRDNASLLLGKYRDELCTFNDDIQGTASVTTAALLSAMRITRKRTEEQKVVLLGAGSAAVGIANQLADSLVDQGMSEEDAAAKFWILNSKGLIHDGLSGILPFQTRFARKKAEVEGWAAQEGYIKLDEVVKRVHPSVLIGVSGKAGMFREAIVKEMAKGCDRPIILPLSNPTSQAEATPADIQLWTDGKAIVATGSPFAPVEYKGVRHMVSQCNNSYVFPGVGLGVIATKAKRVTRQMFRAASKELAHIAEEAPGAPVLPPMGQIRKVSRRIAHAVGEMAMEQGLTKVASISELSERIDDTMWLPDYPQIVRHDVREPVGAGRRR
ncbi:MAG: NAD-dependent malic enzyme [Armatimonadetes bacterium]|nr:NAD-dependent malic enzyme [Armatimonadota bacterium]